MVRILKETFDGTVPGVPDARVREVRSLPGRLPDSVPIGPYAEAAPNTLLFAVPGVARFLVRPDTIEMLVEPGADRASARLFLHTSARAVLILLRGDLALNAATLVTPTGICVALCGRSGSGKSTLAAALIERGWRLLAEEVTHISLEGTNVTAWPSDEALKLWRDTCDDRKLFSPDLESVRPGMERYYVPVPAADAPARLDVAAILRMGPTLSITGVADHERAECFFECSFRPRHIDIFDRRAAHDRIVAQLAATCRMMFVDGARETPVDKLADGLCAAIEKSTAAAD